MKKLIAVVLVAFLLAGGLGGMLMGDVSAEYAVKPWKEKSGTVGKDGKSFRLGYINGIVGEGPTSNENETFIWFNEPTNDNHQFIPDESGTYITTGGTGLITSAMILNGTIVPADIKNAADADLLVGQGTAGAPVWVGITLSGDATGSVANTGGLPVTIGSNKIGAAELNETVHLVSVNVGEATGTVTGVTSGSTVRGYFAFANVTAGDWINSASVTSTTLTVVANSAAVGSFQYKVTTLAP